MKFLITLFISLLIYSSSFSQGRVVINEFMSWPACNTTSEFIELMNFGPGPVDLGCYIVTNGNYAVTIPQNTILQQGQYFVLSGQDVLPLDCGNADSTITVDLNWNTGNVSNVPIPKTGDGFMKDGGGANEKVVLLDPNLQVIDAVSRNNNPSASIKITSSSISGSCSSKTFDLDDMAISYESINIATGKNNSYSRNVDGDCGWVKTPAISANAPNNTKNSSSATYFFTTLTASECNGTHGSISIAVAANNVNSLFPMNYLLAYDADSNGIFNESDIYRYGIDDSSPNININQLAYGRYRITVSSAMGCNLKTFDFFIFNCYGVLLKTDLLKFNIIRFGADYKINYTLTNTEHLEKVVLEASEDGFSFEQIQTFKTVPGSTGNWSPEIKVPIGLKDYTVFRLRIYQLTGENYYSSKVQLKNSSVEKKEKLWPNPAQNNLQVSYFASHAGTAEYKFYNLNGRLVLNGKLNVKAGENVLNFPVNHLIPGNYQLFIGLKEDKKPVRFHFVKQ